MTPQVEQITERRIHERVAVLEANHDNLIKKLEEVVEQLKQLTEFYARSQGFAKGVQWLAGGVLVSIGWILNHLVK
jgi:hypothetical protein